jgi:two-component system sensor histidine kinase PilS (NtrC family)
MFGFHAADRIREAIPQTQSLLRWVYVGRVCVATVVFVAAAFSFETVSPGLLVITSAGAFLSLFVTGWSAFYTHVRNRQPSTTFLSSQMLFDLGLVTTVVHVTGGVNSDFASLYILVIAVSAVTMPLRSTVLVTLAAAMLYIADSIWGHPVALTLSLWLQIGVFIAVALATGWLASRVRVVGAQSRELEREVKRLKLEAGDILREISGGVVTVSGDGALLYANASAERLLGFSAIDAVQGPFLDFLRARSEELYRAIETTQRDGRRQVRAEGTITVGSRTFPIGMTTTPHDNPLDSEELPSVTAIFTDISDQKRLNELHLRTERLEAVAQLSASLAHEIKNPLASIRSSVEQLGRSARSEPDDRFLAELVVRESDRLSRLLSEFLDFSRVKLTDAHQVDLCAIAQMAVDLVHEHPDCPDGARVRVEGDAVEMQGDEDLLHRIVFNLVLNALQASSGEAEITVAVHRARVSELPVGLPPDIAVKLRVTDTGPGIPQHIRERLFDPFVTGREGGTGLGLAIVQRAVEAHRGLVFVDSVLGVGTTFSIYLPDKGLKEAAA